MDDELDGDEMFALAEDIAKAFEQHQGAETGWIAHQLMEFKINYCDPDLTQWRSYELEEILLEVMPRKSSMDDSDIDHVIPVAVSFLRWMGETDRLVGDADALASMVQSWAGRFADAMRDDSRWGMAKRLFSGVDLSNVDANDPRAMQRIIDEFNARPFGERDRILGAVPGAPYVPSLGEVAADELLRVIPDLPERHAASEIDNWLELHNADDLVAALPTAAEAARGLVFRALLRQGETATSAVLTLADVPGFSPWVELWQVDAQLQPPTPVTAADRLIEVLSVVLEMWGSSAVSRWAALLAPDATALVAEAWRLRTAATEDVLAALGDAKDDKALAKTARKSLFKYRSVR